jgi:hypothetical protein
MCSGTEQILTVLSDLWQVNPLSDGADRLAPAAQNLGSGGLVLCVRSNAPIHRRLYALLPRKRCVSLGYERRCGARQG